MRNRVPTSHWEKIWPKEPKGSLFLCCIYSLGRVQAIINDCTLSLATERRKRWWKRWHEGSTGLDCVWLTRHAVTLQISFLNPLNVSSEGFASLFGTNIEKLLIGITEPIDLINCCLSEPFWVHNEAACCHWLCRAWEESRRSTAARMMAECGQVKTILKWIFGLFVLNWETKTFRISKGEFRNSKKKTKERGGKSARRTVPWSMMLKKKRKRNQ